jgi:hypothetical protein
MSETAPETARKPINWLVVALIASLAVNLLIVGAVTARWYAGFGPGERYMRLTQTQLIPRRFFSELDRDRRMELLAVFRAEQDGLRPQLELCNLLAIAQELSSIPRMLVHRDFQSQNVVILNEKPCLIDFQGMRAGLPQYDLAGPTRRRTSRRPNPLSLSGALHGQGHFQLHRHRSGHPPGVQPGARLRPAVYRRLAR